MSTQHYGVFDSITGEPKRFGTCDDIDVAAQASEPNEIAIVCEQSVIIRVQAAQRVYESRRAPLKPGDTIAEFLTRDEKGPFVSPFKAEIVDGEISVIPVDMKAP